MVYLGDRRLGRSLNFKRQLQRQLHELARVEGVEDETAQPRTRLQHGGRTRREPSTGRH